MIELQDGRIDMKNKTVHDNHFSFDGISLQNFNTESQLVSSSHSQGSNIYFIVISVSFIIALFLAFIVLYLKYSRLLRLNEQQEKNLSECATLSSSKYYQITPLRSDEIIVKMESVKKSQ